MQTVILQAGRVLKISSRKVVCELLLAVRLVGFLFTHLFDNRFYEFGNRQQLSAVVAWVLFSFHDRFHRCDWHKGLLRPVRQSGRRQQTVAKFRRPGQVERRFGLEI
jgi:hypothetical protein